MCLDLKVVDVQLNTDTQKAGTNSAGTKRKIKKHPQNGITKCSKYQMSIIE